MRVLKPGLRLKSAVCATEVMVIRGLPGEAQLECGGREMLAVTEPAPADARPDPALAQGSLIGKRYVDAEERYELLVHQRRRGLAGAERSAPGRQAGQGAAVFGLSR